ncbi:dynamin family protein [Mesobacillus zeae]|uniref:GTP-binding protein n=1 Tax=Mesobacillus zeae TaxID=1917180 RepID=A0A398B4R8_9BACI|nr:dynamin family protein [Mesobacillus zeae]RID84434.1 GTP-binding protein [Mesobacillus zeae]
MSLEEKLINKNYYETYLEGNTHANPVSVLGELYLRDHNDSPEKLPNIRFAQGEVYFQHKDFEAAIFKWENIANDFEPWAKKNMGDAFLELGLLESAEELYLSIDTENEVLKIETGLQLLALYIELQKTVRAVEVIKQTVALNPDYPGVTDIARAFFESQDDWENAVQLASNEAIRTHSAEWFDILKKYIDNGYTEGMQPEYFNKVLFELYPADPAKFEQLIVALWKSYRDGSAYLSWIDNFNSIFIGMESGTNEVWKELPALYQESYFELLDGGLLIKQLSPIIPSHLSNWLKVTDESYSLFASSAVMAWSEMFPSSLSPDTVRKAEDMILKARRYPSAMEDSQQLFSSITAWAERNGVETDNRLKWIVGEITEYKNRQLLVAGVSGSGKSAFVNYILGEELLSGPTSSVVAFKYGEEPEIKDVSETGDEPISNYEEFQDAVGVRRQNHKTETIIDFRVPVEFLGKSQLEIIDTPEINRSNVEQHPLYNYVPFADCLLFVLNAEEPLTRKEEEILQQIIGQSPEIPIHFVLNGMDSMYSEQEARQVFEDTLSRLKVISPEAELFAFSGGQKLEGLAEFLHSVMMGDSETARVSKLHYYIRRTITYLLDKRIEMENNLVESVRWNEEMTVKLNGAINQINDMEEEKAREIRRAFTKAKQDTREEILGKVPAILRGCADILTEKSDFRKIHVELNDEMNKRVREFLETTVLRKFYGSLKEWISFSKSEFDQGQVHLQEMAEGFNAMYGEEKLALSCDFKVLDDWNRDADRLTSGVHVEKLNILLRSTPSQIFLKGAGKLLGVLPQNNAMLYNKYKAYLENEDFSETASTVADKFLQQFELFEKSLTRDVNLFFREPLKELEGAVEECNRDIVDSKEGLEKLRIKPEVYRDPLALFETKLRQYEWMSAAGRPASR